MKHDRLPATPDPRGREVLESCHPPSKEVGRDGRPAVHAPRGTSRSGVLGGLIVSRTVVSPPQLGIPPASNPRHMLRQMGEISIIGAISAGEFTRAHVGLGRASLLER